MDESFFSDRLLSVRDLKVQFPVGRSFLRRKQRVIQAVDGISFDLKAGETLGIVGESGCGKSTLARALLRLIPEAEGRVTFLGQELFALPVQSIQTIRRHVQMIFQDPLASLDPRMTIGESIAEPLKTHYPDTGKDAVTRRVKEMMVQVGLMPEMINRYPHEFSGGQCQRIGIARAMILRPQLIVCDEPVSALDVSIQAQIINLLRQLQKYFHLALIFISHDLSVVKAISHCIMVLYLGRLMELAPRDAIYQTPRHPYTQALLSAAPLPDPHKERSRERIMLEGDLPSPLNPPSGCVFATRCPKAAPLCEEVVPPVETIGADHRVACHFWAELGTRKK